MKKSEIEAMTDIEFGISVLQDKLDHMSNPYTPTAKKLREAIAAIQVMNWSQKQKKVNWWKITYFRGNGSAGRALDVPPDELKRISNMVRRGYYEGQMDWRDWDDG